MSRTTYERLKAFCEANNVSMSQLVETRVNDFLGGDGPVEVVRPAMPRPSPSLSSSFGMSHSPPPPQPPQAPRPSMPAAPVRPLPVETKPAAPAPAPAVPMTSAAARSVVEPPPPIIKPRQETAAPKPAEKRPDQIFTF